MKQMKSLRCTTCMLSTLQYQSTIFAMLDERSTKWANSDGAIGLDSRVRGFDVVRVSMATSCCSLALQISDTKQIPNRPSSPVEPTVRFVTQLAQPCTSEQPTGGVV